MTKVVCIPTDRGVKKVPANNIVRIEASSNYSKLFFCNGSLLIVAKVLHWFEDKLEAPLFYRIHRTHMVNSKYIASISIDKSTLTLVNGEQIRISRRRKGSVSKIFA